MISTLAVFAIGLVIGWCSAMAWTVIRTVREDRDWENDL